MHEQVVLMTESNLLSKHQFFNIFVFIQENFFMDILGFNRREHFREALAKMKTLNIQVSESCW